MSRKWEYLCDTREFRPTDILGQREILNSWGEMGWELVSVNTLSYPIKADRTDQMPDFVLERYVYKRAVE